MKAVKNVTWTSKNGKAIEVKIEITREVRTKTANLDGQIVELGKETVDTTYIEVCTDGKYLTRDFCVPQILDPKFYKNYAQLTTAGAYARLGDTYIGKEQYEQIMAVINEINANAEVTEEFKQVKVQETAKENAQIAADKAEAAQYAQELKNGLCPKCGTYCYGDCEAN
jgi:hypothetical protein